MIPISQIETNKGQIKGLPKNPRLIRDEHFKKLLQSIKDNPEMLYLRELLVYPHQGKYVVIGGNMRLMAMKDLGYTEAPCKVIPEDTSIEQLKAYTIKDNAAYGEWDYDLLANEWDEVQLDDWCIDIPDTKAVNPTAEAHEDDFDTDKPVETVCKKGDIWKLGNHRLMCGDSTKAEDVAKLMQGEQADLWLTDPPYNVDYEGHAKHLEKSGRPVASTGKIMNDFMDEETFLNFLFDAFTTAKENMKNGAAFYIWHSDSHGFTFRQAAHQSGLQVRQTLIWNKNQLVIGRQDYQWKHEPCLYGWKDGAAHHWYSDRKQTTVIDWERPKRSEEHPTMKPIGLFGYQMQNSSMEGDIILDSFGGSGTTIMAAEQLGRKARLMELDPHYCNVIIARWEQFTGQKAKLLTNTKTAEP